METLRKRKILYWVTSFLMLAITTLVLFILLINKPKMNREKLFTISWSLTLTIIILIAATFLINQRIAKIVWTIDIFLGVVVGNKIGMIIVLVIYLIYDILFSMYEKYKLRLTIRKEIESDDT